MNCRELKMKINENKLDVYSLILKYTDNKFLCYQYIDEICKNKQLNKVFINNIKEIPTDSFLEEDTLYVWDAEKIEGEIPEIHNLIVMCNKVGKDISCVDLPKLQNWQIEDYVKVCVPGLDDQQRKWLCEITQYDIFRLDQECKKLEMFPNLQQKNIFMQLNEEGGYADLTSLTIFNFTNALLKKDYKTLATIIKDLDTIDVEGTGVVTLMIRNIKNLIDIQFNSTATAATLGLKDNQYYAIKQNVNRFTNNQLINMFEFLTTIDTELKAGNLMLCENTNHLTWNNMLVDYLTVNLLNIANS